MKTETPLKFYYCTKEGKPVSRGQEKPLKEKIKEALANRLTKKKFYDNA